MQEEITVSPPTIKAREPVKERRDQTQQKKVKPGPNSKSAGLGSLEMKNKKCKMRFDSERTIKKYHKVTDDHRS